MAGKEGVVRELGQVYWHSPIPPAFMSIETVHLNAYTMADEPKPGSRGVRVQRMKGTTMTDPVYKGACMCGAVRFEARGEPLRTGMCHCTTCRRNTGSAFTVYAVFPAARLRMLGDETGSYATSEHLTRHFCRVCGAPAFVEERGEMIRALGRFRRRGSVHAHLRAVRGQPAPVAAAGARPRILRARPRLVFAETAAGMLAGICPEGRCRLSSRAPRYVRRPSAGSLAGFSGLSGPQIRSK